MDGLTPKQYIEIQEFIQKYHRFAGILNDEDYEYMKNNFPNMAKWDRYGLCIKYIDTCYDSRKGDIWSVSFRGMGNDVNFNTNMFNKFSDIKKPKDWRWHTLYDNIMAYLKGEMTDKQMRMFIIKK